MSLVPNEVRKLTKAFTELGEVFQQLEGIASIEQATREANQRIDAAHASEAKAKEALAAVENEIAVANENVRVAGTRAVGIINDAEARAKGIVEEATNRASTIIADANLAVNVASAKVKEANNQLIMVNADIAEKEKELASVQRQVDSFKKRIAQV